VARPQDGWPAAVLYPSGHPTPFAKLFFFSENGFEFEDGGPPNKSQAAPRRSQQHPGTLIGQDEIPSTLVSNVLIFRENIITKKTNL
jgi:hypothetical protein